MLKSSDCKREYFQIAKDIVNDDDELKRVYSKINSNKKVYFNLKTSSFTNEYNRYSVMGIEESEFSNVWEFKEKVCDRAYRIGNVVLREK